MSKVYRFETKIIINSTIEKVWDFFSSASNLARITPPEMDFKILSDVEVDVYEGLIIDYKVKPLFGIPVFWRTRIAEVDKPRSFTDSQIKGPYKLWEHTHNFQKVPEGILMTDIVKYQLPLGILGTLAHKLFVRKQVEKIFSHREKVLQTLF